MTEEKDIKKINKMLKIYEPLFKAIDVAVSSHDDLIIAIDGYSTSGKSTLADLICQKYNANVFHMDDFFRSQSQGKSNLDYASNIDFERLKAEVILPLSKKYEVEYKAFNCRTQKYMESVHKSYQKINVIEGAYSMHPEISSSYKMKVFLTSTYIQQLRRIIKRNGFKDIKMFIQKWIPYERRYFKHFKIKQQSDYIFKSRH